MDAVIEARGLVKAYDGKRAVDEISFEVWPGECFGLLGPNGAGKTSTVKMIYGFSPVTAGELVVLGRDVRSRAREIKRRIGVVPQENNLDLDLTVTENLLVYASFFDMAAASARVRVEELLDFFGLAEKTTARVDDLSGGMKRRLTIARALINSPEILLLDEPTTGLDPQARHLIWQRLRRLKEQGVTLLLTTHYMDEAAQLCDRLVIMDLGRILEEGSPTELVKKHIRDGVLVLGGGADFLDEILEVGGEETRERLLIGDTLFLYPEDGAVLLDKLRPLNTRFSQVMLRGATLEDVFLKLTGRGLDE
ncbi:MAG: ATP-binding cassette domain-containing protein [Firmicutes bacterium]|nr:ATP-binding cassette domain-containing protein [Bacillota bacterium]